MYLLLSLSGMTPSGSTRPTIYIYISSTRYRACVSPFRSTGLLKYPPASYNPKWALWSQQAVLGHVHAAAWSAHHMKEYGDLPMALVRTHILVSLSLPPSDTASLWKLPCAIPRLTGTRIAMPCGVSYPRLIVGGICFVIVGFLVVFFFFKLWRFLPWERLYWQGLAKDVAAMRVGGHENLQKLAHDAKVSSPAGAVSGLALWAPLLSCLCCWLCSGGLWFSVAGQEDPSGMVQPEMGSLVPAGGAGGHVHAAAWTAHHMKEYGDLPMALVRTHILVSLSLPPSDTASLWKLPCAIPRLTGTRIAMPCGVSYPRLIVGGICFVIVGFLCYWVIDVPIYRVPALMIISGVVFFFFKLWRFLPWERLYWQGLAKDVAAMRVGGHENLQKLAHDAKVSVAAAGWRLPAIGVSRQQAPCRGLPSGPRFCLACAVGCAPAVSGFLSLDKKIPAAWYNPKWALWSQQAVLGVHAAAWTAHHMKEYGDLPMALVSTHILVSLSLPPSDTASLWKLPCAIPRLTGTRIAMPCGVSYPRLIVGGICFVIVGFLVVFFFFKLWRFLPWERLYWQGLAKDVAAMRVGGHENLQKLAHDAKVSVAAAGWRLPAIGVSRQQAPCRGLPSGPRFCLACAVGCAPAVSGFLSLDKKIPAAWYNPKWALWSQQAVLGHVHAAAWTAHHMKEYGDLPMALVRTHILVSLSLPPSDTASLWKLPCAIPRLTGTRIAMPCGVSYPRLIVGGICFVIVGFLCYWVIDVPIYRVPALMIISGVVFFFFKLWRFLPWERLYWQGLAKDVAAMRVGGHENLQKLAHDAKVSVAAAGWRLPAIGVSRQQAPCRGLPSGPRFCLACAVGCAPAVSGFLSLDKKIPAAWYNPKWALWSQQANMVICPWRWCAPTSSSLFLSLPLTLLLCGNCLVRSPAWYTGTRIAMPCGVSYPRLIVGGICFVIVGFLCYWVIDVPIYRVPALMIISGVVFFFKLWRFLPWERLYWQGLAKDVAAMRVGGHENLQKLAHDAKVSRCRRLATTRHWGKSPAGAVSGLALWAPLCLACAVGCAPAVSGFLSLDKKIPAAWYNPKWALWSQQAVLGHVHAAAWTAHHMKEYGDLPMALVRTHILVSLLPPSDTASLWKLPCAIPRLTGTRIAMPCGVSYPRLIVGGICFVIVGFLVVFFFFKLWRFLPWERLYWQGLAKDVAAMRVGGHENLQKLAHDAKVSVAAAGWRLPAIGVSRQQAPCRGLPSGPRFCLACAVGCAPAVSGFLRCWGGGHVHAAAWTAHHMKEYGDLPMALVRTHILVSLSPSDTASLWKLPCAIPRLTGTRIAMPCGVSYPRLIVGGICFVIVGFLCYWVIDVPIYRVPALMIISGVVFFFFKLWRFLPWERLYWQGLAKDVAAMRVGGHENLQKLAHDAKVSVAAAGWRLPAIGVSRQQAPCRGLPSGPRFCLACAVGCAPAVSGFLSLDKKIPAAWYNPKWALWSQQAVLGHVHAAAWTAHHMKEYGDLPMALVRTHILVSLSLPPSDTASLWKLPCAIPRLTGTRIAMPCGVSYPRLIVGGICFVIVGFLVVFFFFKLWRFLPWERLYWQGLAKDVAAMRVGGHENLQKLAHDAKVSVAAAGWRLPAIGVSRQQAPCRGLPSGPRFCLACAVGCAPAVSGFLSLDKKIPAAWYNPKWALWSQQAVLGHVHAAAWTAHHMKEYGDLPMALVRTHILVSLSLPLTLLLCGNCLVRSPAWYTGTRIAMPCGVSYPRLIVGGICFVIVGFLVVFFFFKLWRFLPWERLYWQGLAKDVAAMRVGGHENLQKLAHDAKVSVAAAGWRLPAIGVSRQQAPCRGLPSGPRFCLACAVGCAPAVSGFLSLDKKIPAAWYNPKWALWSQQANMVICPWRWCAPTSSSLFLSLPLTLLLCGNCLVRSPAWYTGTRIAMPCGVSYPRLIVGGICFVIVGFLCYWVIDVPIYRVPALMIISGVVFFFFKLWRFLPWERLYWQGLAKDVAAMRVGGHENLQKLAHDAKVSVAAAGWRLPAIGVSRQQAPCRGLPSGPRFCLACAVGCAPAVSGFLSLDKKIPAAWYNPKWALWSQQANMVICPWRWCAPTSSSLSLPPSDTASLWKLPCAIPRLTGTRIAMPCGVSYPRLIVGGICFVIVGFLCYWVIDVPIYRVPALMIISGVVFFFFKLWRFLPWERLYWQGLAKDVAAMRVGGHENLQKLAHDAKVSRCRRLATTRHWGKSPAGAVSGLALWAPLLSCLCCWLCSGGLWFSVAGQEDPSGMVQPEMGSLVPAGGAGGGHVHAAAWTAHHMKEYGDLPMALVRTHILTGTRIAMPCGVSYPRLIVGGICFVIVGFLVVFFFFKLWRFLPWERLYWQGLAKDVAAMRVGGHENLQKLAHDAKVSVAAAGWRLPAIGVSRQQAPCRGLPSGPRFCLACAVGCAPAVSGFLRCWGHVHAAAWTAHHMKEYGDLPMALVRTHILVSLLSLPLTLLLCGNCLVRSPAWYTGTRIAMPCGVSYPRLIVGGICFVIVGFLCYWVIDVPIYRVPALMIISGVVFFFFKLWRFLPWERLYWQGLAKDVAAMRVGGHENLQKLAHDAKVSRCRRLATTRHWGKSPAGAVSGLALWAPLLSCLCCWLCSGGLWFSVAGQEDPSGMVQPEMGSLVSAFVAYNFVQDRFSCKEDQMADRPRGGDTDGFFFDFDEESVSAAQDKQRAAAMQRYSNIPGVSIASFPWVELTHRCAEDPVSLVGQWARRYPAGVSSSGAAASRTGAPSSSRALEIIVSRTPSTLRPFRLCYQSSPVVEALTRPPEASPAPAKEAAPEATRSSGPHRDIVPGRYYGGLKVWSCAPDLARYLLEHEAEWRPIFMRSSFVAEVGCGHALPGLAALCLGAPRLLLQDYNAEVLDTCAGPNVLATFLTNRIDVSDREANAAEDGEPQDQSRAPSTPQVKLLFGDWVDLRWDEAEIRTTAAAAAAEDAVSPAPSDSGGCDVILGSDVTFDKEACDKLAVLLARWLRPVSGIAVIATKEYYFGTNGGRVEFMESLAPFGLGVVKTHASIRDGGSMDRVIIQFIIYLGIYYIIIIWIAALAFYKRRSDRTIKRGIDICLLSFKQRCVLATHPSVPTVTEKQNKEALTQNSSCNNNNNMLCCAASRHDVAGSASCTPYMFIVVVVVGMQHSTEEQHSTSASLTPSSSSQTGPSPSTSICIKPSPFAVPPPPRDILVGPAVYFGISVFTLVLASISLGLPWFTMEQYKSPLYEHRSMKSTFTLWHTYTEVEGSNKLTIHVSDYCWPVRRRVRVAEAFACATVVGMLLSSVFGYINMRKRGERDRQRRLCAGFALFTFIFGTIASAMVITVYYWSFTDCGEGSSFHSQLYELSSGFGFFITAWILTFVSGLVVPSNATVPLDARTLDSAIFLYVLLAFMGLLFSATACPIPHWFYKDAYTRTSTDITLWKTVDSAFNWEQHVHLATNTTLPSSYACAEITHMFYAASVFSLVAVAAHLASLVWGALLWQGVTSFVPPAMVFTVLGGSVSFVQCVVETVIYWKEWCDGVYAYKKHKFVLAPGYALCVVSFCVMLIAGIFIVTVYLGITKYFPSKLTRTPALIKNSYSLPVFRWILAPLGGIATLLLYIVEDSLLIPSSLSLSLSSFLSLLYIYIYIYIYIEVLYLDRIISITIRSSLSSSQLKTVKTKPRPYVVPPAPREATAGPVVFLLLSIVNLVLLAVSLGLPWYKVEQYESALYDGKTMKSTVTLWETRTEIDGLPEMTTKAGDYCWPVMRRVRVMEAFACASTAAALVCVVLGILNVRAGGESQKLRRICTGMDIVLFCFTVVTVSFNFSVYYWSFKDCGAQSSFHSKLYEPSFGFAFTITAWVLMFFAGLIVSFNAKIFLDARRIDTTILLYVIFALCGTVFSITSTPVLHWFYKDGAIKKAIDVTLWQTKTGNFDWDLLASKAKDYVSRGDYTCDRVTSAFKVASGVSIAAGAVNFLALFWAVLLWQYLVISVIPGIVFSILGFLLSVATFVIETIIFKNNWCDGAYAYEKKKFVLGAGYALMASAFCTMLLSSIFSILSHLGIKKFFPNGSKKPVDHEEFFSYAHPLLFGYSSFSRLSANIKHFFSFVACCVCLLVFILLWVTARNKGEEVKSHPQASAEVRR
eukprot:gene1360-795_t